MFKVDLVTRHLEAEWPLEAGGSNCLWSVGELWPDIPCWAQAAQAKQAPTIREIRDNLLAGRS